MLKTFYPVLDGRRRKLQQEETEQLLEEQKKEKEERKRQYDVLKESLPKSMKVLLNEKTVPLLKSQLQPPPTLPPHYFTYTVGNTDPLVAFSELFAPDPPRLYPHTRRRIAVHSHAHYVTSGGDGDLSSGDMKDGGNDDGNDILNSSSNNNSNNLYQVEGVVLEEDVVKWWREVDDIVWVRESSTRSNNDKSTSGRNSNNNKPNNNIINGIDLSQPLPHIASLKHLTTSTSAPATSHSSTTLDGSETESNAMDIDSYTNTENTTTLTPTTTSTPTTTPAFTLPEELVGIQISTWEKDIVWDSDSVKQNHPHIIGEHDIEDIRQSLVFDRTITINNNTIANTTVTTDTDYNAAATKSYENENTDEKNENENNTVGMNDSVNNNSNNNNNHNCNINTNINDIHDIDDILLSTPQSFTSSNNNKNNTENLKEIRKEVELLSKLLTEQSPSITNTNTGNTTKTVNNKNTSTFTSTNANVDDITNTSDNKTPNTDTKDKDKENINDNNDNDNGDIDNDDIDNDENFINNRFLFEDFTPLNPHLITNGSSKQLVMNNAIIPPTTSDNNDWLSLVVWQCNNTKQKHNLLNSKQSLCLLDRNDPYLIFDTDVISEEEEEEEEEEQENSTPSIMQVQVLPSKRRKGRKRRGLQLPHQMLTAKELEYKKRLEAAASTESDPFNLSNDLSYLPQQAESAVGSGGTYSGGSGNTVSGSSGVTLHSIAGQKLASVKVEPLTMHLEHFHRPRPILGTDVDFVKALPIKAVKPRRIKGDPFRHKKGLSAKEGRVVVIEYVEEFPPILTNMGMGSRIRNYYRKSEVSEDFSLVCEDGETISLLPRDKSPFIADIPPSHPIQSLENNVYKVPLFKHTPKHSDFLLVRPLTSDNQLSNYYTLRKIPALYTAGQIFPLREVPSPHSRWTSMFVNERLSHFVLKRFKEERDTKSMNSNKSNKSYSNSGVSVRTQDISNSFPSQSENTIRKQLKLLASYHRGGDDIGSWLLNPGVMLPSDEAIRRGVDPDDTALYECMLAGQCRLMKHGVFEFHNKLSSTILQDHFSTTHPLRAAAKLVDEELLLTPWNLTSNFVHALKGTCILQLTGLGDPSGCGEGFSYLRAPQKPIQPRSKVKKEPEKLVKKVVTGTGADLRKLTMEETYDLLASFGLPRDEILALPRWKRVGLIRKLSNDAKAEGMGEKMNVLKFARGSKFNVQVQQGQMEKKLEEIFKNQIDALSKAESPDISEESDDDLELELFEKDLESELINSTTHTTGGTPGAHTHTSTLPHNHTSSNTTGTHATSSVFNGGRAHTGTIHQQVEIGKKLQNLMGTRKKQEDEEEEKRAYAKFMSKKLENGELSTPTTSVASLPTNTTNTPLSPHTPIPNITTSPISTVPSTPTTTTSTPPTPMLTPKNVEKSTFITIDTANTHHHRTKLTSGLIRRTFTPAEGQVYFIKRTRSLQQHERDAQNISNNDSNTGTNIVITRVSSIVTDTAEVQRLLTKQKQGHAVLMWNRVSRESSNFSSQRKRYSVEQQNLRKRFKLEGYDEELGERGGSHRKRGKKSHNNSARVSSKMLTPVSETSAAKSNIRCGKCGMMGHRRTNKKCPMYENSASASRGGNGARVRQHVVVGDEMEVDDVRSTSSGLKDDSDDAVIKDGVGGVTVKAMGTSLKISSKLLSTPSRSDYGIMDDDSMSLSSDDMDYDK